ncbi:high affinity methionine permease [Pseudozyma hubeiensis SY62]|uniref:High affinity methionine permease n=1 Tax=Pseudozyma hubeiensis (strain SY62) TaxID=1305764 RepID=R9PDJ7_PSEHS|nr:high affinity methionine permease [Pseudozyma hubeiensis SY62]GAC99421.1 high affinity methionine permease [Pseudozyma hubeiensis SY62]
MSSSDTAAAKQAAGQLQKDQAELTGSDHLKSAGHTEFQHGKGIENAQEGTGASGFGQVAGAKDAVKEQASANKDE